MDLENPHEKGLKIYNLSKKMVDPDSIQKSKDYSPSFGIEIHHMNACDMCSPSNPIEELCSGCAKKTRHECKDWD
jgi:hypothetical protein